MLWLQLGLWLCFLGVLFRLLGLWLQLGLQLELWLEQQLWLRLQLGRRLWLFRQHVQLLGLWP